MFGKLMKHEFRATRKAMWVLCLTALGVAILGGCAMGYLARFDEMTSEGIEMLCAMVTGFSVFLIALCGAGAFVLMVYRFYKSRFTDEGYLTFTLPVTGHQVLLSSMVSSTLNMALAILVVMASYGLMAAIGCSFVEGFWAAVAERLPEIWKMMAGSMTGEYWGYFALALFDVLISFIGELVIIMLAITMGAVAAKKHKILAALGLYYGINLAISILSGVVISSGMIHFTRMMGTFAVLLSIPALLGSVFALAGYFLTHYLITRKLNLA